MKRIWWFIVPAALCTWIACSKNDGTTVSKTQLLCSAAWKYDTAGIDADNNGSIDAALPAGYVQDCKKDNIVSFKSDGTGTSDEGASKCNAGDPQTSSFTWSFINNETGMNFPQQVFTGFDGDVNLKSLTSTQMILMKQVSISPTQTVNVVVQLRH